jgi:ubiquitin-protein ligase
MENKFNARILKEIKKGQTSDLFQFFWDTEGIFDEKNICFIKWTVQEGTYKGQTHVLRVAFTYGSNELKMFPQNPPNVTFITPIFHTNISMGGAICLDVLRDDPQSKQSWSALYGIEIIFNSIIALLENHNPKSPFNHDASDMYQKKDSQFFTSYCNAFYASKLKTSGYQVAKKIIDYDFQKNKK